MKVLLTGGTGQLGRALLATNPGFEIVAPSRESLDITQKAQVEAVFAKVKPKLVLHTAAYTAVDEAELHPKLAFAINVLGTRNLVEAAQKQGARFFYISTDYVFNGKKSQPYTEKDKPDPLSVYGQTKLAGERAVNKLPKSHWWIVRSAWLYGEGKNFVRTILELAKRKKTLKVVADQKGSPTYAYDLAKALWELVEKAPGGLYHLVNSESCSWYELARAILELKGLKRQVIPITTDQLNRPAPRPAYSVLKSLKAKKLNLAALRPWRAALADYLRTLP